GVSFEQVRQRMFFDKNRTIVRVHLGGSRPKQKIDPSGATKFFVLLFWPRITLVVAARLELQRIHKNADHDFAIFAGFLSRDSDQFPMGFVQCAHRRHEDAAFCRFAPWESGDGSGDVHGATMNYSNAPRELERSSEVRN